MGLATIIRLEFSSPGVGVFAGDSLQYLSVATAHGVIMVFFMIMPSLFGAFGNFLLPTQLGVHDVAFPRLNSAAFWFLPGGLIMLAQLVCVDRRYQRMNCFNIRELQSVLRKKFFTDLVNTNDHKELLNSTMVGLRFKNNSSTLLSTDISAFYNQGTSFGNKFKSVSLLNLNQSDMDLYAPLVTACYNYIYPLFDGLMSIVLNLSARPIYARLFPSDLFSEFTFNTDYYNIILAYDEFIFNLVRVIQNLSLMPLTSLHTSFSFFFEIVAWNVNWYTITGG